MVAGEDGIGSQASSWFKHSFLGGSLLRLLVLCCTGSFKSSFFKGLLYKFPQLGLRVLLFFGVSSGLGLWDLLDLGFGT